MSISQPMQVLPLSSESFLRQNFMVNSGGAAVCALILFEHTLTIEEELRHFWRSEWAPSKLLFFANRYALLLFALLNLGEFAQLDTRGCAVVSTCIAGCIFALETTEALFAALRAFAIGGYSWTAFVFVLFLGMTTVLANIHLLAKTRFSLQIHGNKATCANNLENVSEATYYRCLVISAVTTILSDAVVLSMTWWKTWGIKRAAMQARAKAPLVTILLRDGTLYFAAITCLNIAQAIIQVYNSGFDFMTFLLTPLPPICISRFLFNLRSSSRPRCLASLNLSESDTTRMGLELDELEWNVDAHPTSVNTAEDEIARQVDDTEHARSPDGRVNVGLAL